MASSVGISPHGVIAGTPWVSSGAGLATTRQWLSSKRIESSGCIHFLGLLADILKRPLQRPIDERFAVLFRLLLRFGRQSVAVCLDSDDVALAAVVEILTPLGRLERHL